MDSFIISVVGSRDFYDRGILNEILNTVIQKYHLNHYEVFLCSGGAKGADTLAQNYAKENGYPIIIYYPDYKNFGGKAPLVRNVRIISSADLVIALWDGKSKGTLNALSAAERLEKSTIIYNKSNGSLTTDYRGGIFNDN